jgi:hypothetical protein
MPIEAFSLTLSKGKGTKLGDVGKYCQPIRIGWQYLTFGHPSHSLVLIGPGKNALAYFVTTSVTKKNVFLTIDTQG